MSSDTDIANRALRLLKAGRISSLTDGTKNANALNDVYTEVRDTLLRAHKWNFAKRRVKLAKNATAPTFGYDNAFSLPSDWVRTILVSNNDAGAGDPPSYSEEEVDNQGVIASDEDELWLSYVYRVTDPNRMTPDFRAAFSCALALAAPGISNLSAAREDRLDAKCERLIRAAKFSDAQGSSPERRPRGSWADSRGGLQSWRDWPN